MAASCKLKHSIEPYQSQMQQACIEFNYRANIPCFSDHLWLSKLQIERQLRCSSEKTLLLNDGIFRYFEAFPYYQNITNFKECGFFALIPLRSRMGHQGGNVRTILEGNSLLLGLYQVSQNNVPLFVRI